MALFDAKEYSPSPARRLLPLIAVIAIVAAVSIGALSWFYRYWPEEHVVNKFFAALERKDFDAAYGIYFSDPDWKEHPTKYSQYSLPLFMRDWGALSQYGIVASHKIECATEPPKKGPHSSSGVLVVANVNGRFQTMLWVEKKDKIIGIAPPLWDVHCRVL
jgi:hypothetical protein